LNSKLKEIISKIEDKSLREKVTKFVANPTLKIEGKVYKGLPLESSPAGVSHHHAYPGGFTEHVVSTTQIALTLCDVVEEVYHGRVDRDLVVAGSILHDIFKPLTYTERENGTYGVTPLAERLDHLTLIVSELVGRGFPLDLIHIVGAHMGWQHGPIGPRTAEALIVHLADVADSRLNGEVLRAAQYLSREATGMELERITSREAFEIVRSKTIKGWGGVKETVEKIRERRLKAFR